MIKKTITKKIVLLATGLLMSSMLVGCGAVQDAINDALNGKTEIEEDIVIEDGGFDYSGAYGVGVPEEIKEAYEMAVANHDGELVPLTVVSQQVVAGMNYNILCKDENNMLKTAQIYADLEGGAVLSGVYDVYMTMPKSESDEPVSGGWGTPMFSDKLELEGEQKEIFEKALDGFVGSNIEPLAYLGNQVVAGMNYKYVCRVTPVTPNAGQKIQVVVIYVDLDGNATFTDFYDIG